MDPKQAQAFVDAWLTAWNDHDVDGVLDHFTEDAVFTSPVAVRVLPGSDGILRGKSAIRDYWTTALGRVPDLQFDLVAVYVGVTTLVINYRNQRGALVSEVLTFDGGSVVSGHGTYLTADVDPAGVSGARD